MNFWLLIILTLTIQEGLSVLAVLLKAYQLHYSLWIIHVIWLVVTSVQIGIGYVLGKWLQKRYAGMKFERWVNKHAKRLETSIHKSGENVALMLLSSIISPFIAAFLAAWLDITFLNVFMFALLGDLFWYASTWAYVLGATAILAKAKYGLIIVLAIAFIFVLISQYRKSKTS
jgi:hypothetical protein